MGEADLMSAALLLDVASYYIGLVRPVYRDPEWAFARLPFEGRPGRIAASMIRFYRRRLVALAKNRAAAGRLGETNSGWRELYDGFVPDFRLRKQIGQGRRRWCRAEWRNLTMSPRRAQFPPAPGFHPHRSAAKSRDTVEYKALRPRIPDCSMTTRPRDACVFRR